MAHVSASLFDIDGRANATPRGASAPGRSLSFGTRAILCSYEEVFEVNNIAFRINYFFPHIRAGGSSRKDSLLAFAQNSRQSRTIMSPDPTDAARMIRLPTFGS
jgi:hypothetical protein